MSRDYYGSTVGVGARTKGYGSREFTLTGFPFSLCCLFCVYLCRLSVARSFSLNLRYSLSSLTFVATVLISYPQLRTASFRVLVSIHMFCNQVVLLFQNILWGLTLLPYS